MKCSVQVASVSGQIGWTDIVTGLLYFNCTYCIDRNVECMFIDLSKSVCYCLAAFDLLKTRTARLQWNSMVNYVDPSHACLKPCCREPAKYLR